MAVGVGVGGGGAKVGLGDAERPATSGDGEADSVGTITNVGGRPVWRALSVGVGVAEEGASSRHATARARRTLNIKVRVKREVISLI